MKKGSLLRVIGLIIFSTNAMWGGQSVVPGSLKGNKEFSFAVEFIERYHKLLLSRKGTENSVDSIRIAKDRGLKYSIGNDSEMVLLKGEEDFSLTLNDGIYSARWCRIGKPLVAIDFPSRMELLTFSNKIELENRMVEMLESSIGKDEKRLPTRVEISKLSKIDYSPFYVRDLGYYITPKLSHREIYLPSNSDPHTCEMLSDSSNYPLESLSNVLLSGYSHFPVLIKLKLDRYGYQATSITLSIDELFSVLSEEGSIPFWGVDKYDGSNVHGLYVWLNRSGGFAHVLDMDIPIASLSSSSEVKANMHCYVRLDNLKSLFEE